MQRKSKLSNLVDLYNDDWKVNPEPSNLESSALLLSYSHQEVLQPVEVEVLTSHYELTDHTLAYGRGLPILTFESSSPTP